MKMTKMIFTGFYSSSVARGRLVIMNKRQTGTFCSQTWQQGKTEEQIHVKHEFSEMNVNHHLNKNT